MATIQEMIKDGAFSYGDQSFGPSSVREGDVGVIGAGAAGAWAVEAQAGKIKEGGKERTNDVEWIGQSPNERTDEAKAHVQSLVDKVKEERAKVPVNEEAVRTAEKALSDYTFEKATGNGNLPRNREEGAAFHEDMQEGGKNKDGVPGNISRRVMQGVEKVEYVSQTPGGPKRVKLTVKDVTGKEVVIWKDSLVLSIGQDPKGESPKGELGPAKMLEQYGGKMKPIFGPPDETGWRPIVGLQSEDGSVRVLGAAATSRDVGALMADETKGGVSVQDHQDNLAKQASTLSPDSKGVVPGFEMSQKTITAANGELTRKVQLTEAQQRAEEKGLIPRATEPMEATPVDKLPQEKRDQAAREYKTQIEALNRDGQLPMPNGKASVKMMADITAATGKEVALVRLKDGKRVLLMGHEHHVDVPEGSKIIAHTHPNGDLQLSFEDEMALHARGQKTSVLIGADGTAGRFGVHDDVEKTGTRSNQLHEPGTSEEGKTPTGPTEIEPSELKFTQNYVSPDMEGPAKADGSEPDRVSIADVQQSMATGGWRGSPAEVIRMPDGSLTSLNNRRIVAAHKAVSENGGLGGGEGGAKKTTIPAQIHDWEEKLPAEYANRFKSKHAIYQDPETGEYTKGGKPNGRTPIIPKNHVATTYREAVLIRNANQDKILDAEGKKTDTPWPITGSYTVPYIKPRGEGGEGQPTVQRKASGEMADGAAMAPGEIAKRGTAGSGGQLPHLEQIQRAFGRHDVSGIRAHVGGEAAASSRALGAQAYAVGDAIAFSGTPDLHTAAHEAAHVVQQRAGVTKSGGIDGGASDEHEKHADAVADVVVRGGDASALLDQISGGGGTGEMAVQRKGDAGLDVLAREMTSKEKAADMLRHTPPDRRGTVESIVRSKFSKEDADEIISKNPAGGKEPPKPQKGQPKKTNAAADAKGKKGGAAAKHSKMPTRGKSAPVAKTVAEKKEEGINDVGAFKGVSTGDLALIHQELIEHEQWKAAQNEVGAAGSDQRAEFVVNSASNGIAGAFGKGLATGAGGAAVTKGVGWLATKGLMKAGIAVGGEEIPGIGPIIAGAFSAYALLTKNWKETGEKIAMFGQGEDTYDMLANSLQSIAEIIDIVVNVLNVIAAVVAAIGLIMWIVTIATLGAAAPLAITLTEIAAGVVTATLILDAIAKLVINPWILMFRAMHTFKSEADPRDVKEQGETLSETANQTVGFVGNIAGGKAADAGIEAGGKALGGKGGGGGSPEEAPKTETAPKSEPAKTEPAKTEPAKTEPAKTEPVETKGGHEEPPKEPTEGKDEGKEGKDEKAPEKSRQEKLKEAQEKLKEAQAERKKIQDELKEKLAENRKAREEAQEAHDEAIKRNREENASKLEKVEADRQAKIEKIEAERKATVEKIQAEAKTSEQKFEAAEKSAEAQRKAAADAKEGVVGSARERLEAKTGAADERLKAAEAKTQAEAQHSADGEFKARESSIEKEHAASTKKISEIEDPEIKAQEMKAEQERYAQEKADLAADKAKRADELAKPGNDKAKAARDRDVKQAQDEFDSTQNKANDAEAKANAKTQRELDRAKAARDEKQSQLDKQDRKSANKEAYDKKRANDDSDIERQEADSEQYNKNREADEKLADRQREIKADNEAERTKGNKELHENKEETEEAQEGVNKNRNPVMKALKIIADWGIKPWLIDPYNPFKVFDKAHRDIDLLPPTETTLALLKKEKKEGNEEALAPKGDAAADKELANLERERGEDKEKEEKALAERQRTTKWPGAFGQGLAGKEPESVEKQKRKVSPNYQDSAVHRSAAQRREGTDRSGHGGARAVGEEEVGRARDAGERDGQQREARRSEQARRGSRRDRQSAQGSGHGEGRRDRGAESAREAGAGHR
ncbi:MAG: DUF4157 domain-containing protein [Kofleriaceae bacterium]